MTTIINIAVIAVACLAASLTYVAAEQVMNRLSLGSPRVISFVVAMLTFLAILELGKGIILLLLIPYAALVLTLVALYLSRFFNTKMRNSTTRAARNTQRFLQRMWCTHTGKSPHPRWTWKIAYILDRERIKIRKFIGWR